MNDFDMYIARTQARLAFFLITILVLLTALLMSIMIFPSLKPQSDIISLLVQVVTGVLALCGSAIAYFFARHRPPTKGDDEDGRPSASEKTINTTVTEKIVTPPTPPLSPPTTEKPL